MQRNHYNQNHRRHHHDHPYPHKQQQQQQQQKQKQQQQQHKTTTKTTTTTTLKALVFIFVDAITIVRLFTLCTDIPFIFLRCHDEVKPSSPTRSCNVEYDVDGESNRPRLPYVFYIRRGEG